MRSRSTNRAVADAGDIYVANNKTVLVYAASGTFLGELSGGEMCGVAVDPSGSVYVGIYPETVRKYMPLTNPVTNGDETSSMAGLHQVCNVAATVPATCMPPRMAVASSAMKRCSWLAGRDRHDDRRTWTNARGRPVQRRCLRQHRIRGRGVRLIRKPARCQRRRRNRRFVGDWRECKREAVRPKRWTREDIRRRSDRARRKR